MPSITKTQLENAAVDVESLQAVINGPAQPGLVVTRLGRQVKTLARITGELAASDIGASVAAELNNKNVTGYVHEAASAVAGSSTRFDIAVQGGYNLTAVSRTRLSVFFENDSLPNMTFRLNNDPTTERPVRFEDSTIIPAGYFKTSQRATFYYRALTGFWHLVDDVAHSHRIDAIEQDIAALENAQNSFTKSLVALALRDKDWLSYARNTASFHLDAQSVYTGPANAVTGIVADGSLNFTFPVIGTGAPVQMTADGIKFEAGQYLQLSNLSQSYTRAMVVVDFTRDAAPAGAAGDVLRLDTSVDEQTNVRYVATGSQAMLPGNVTNVFAIETGVNGSRTQIAMVVNYINATAQTMDIDGLVVNHAIAAGDGDVDIDQIRIGGASNITLHSATVYLLPSGSFPQTMQQMWALMTGKDDPTVTQNKIIINMPVCQSEGLGRNAASERAYINAINRPQVFGMTGLKTGGADVFIHGSSGGSLDQGTPATGLIPAFAQGNIPPSLMAAVIGNKYRADVGLSPCKYGVQVTGRAGAAWEEFDNNNPVSGVTGSLLIDNYTYALREIVRLSTLAGFTPEMPYLTIWKGTAESNSPAGHWTTTANKAIGDITARIVAELGAPPRYLLIQSGGVPRTDNAVYNQKVEEVDWVRSRPDAALIAPAYPCLLDDTYHPTQGASSDMAELEAWCRAELDFGNTWSLIPKFIRVGNVLRFVVSTRGDESLTLDTSNKYAGVGVGQWGGFEVTGANIVDMIVSGSEVALICDAPPTSARYAMQSQNLAPASPPAAWTGYSGHRGLLRTTLWKPSRIYPGHRIYRWVPSYRQIFS